jgi:hypothetical protein
MLVKFFLKEIFVEEDRVKKSGGPGMATGSKGQGS